MLVGEDIILLHKSPCELQGLLCCIVGQGLAPAVECVDFIRSAFALRATAFIKSLHLLQGEVANSSAFGLNCLAEGITKRSKNNPLSLQSRQLPLGIKGSLFI